MRSRSTAKKPRRALPAKKAAARKKAKPAQTKKKAARPTGRTAARKVKKTTLRKAAGRTSAKAGKSTARKPTRKAVSKRARKTAVKNAQVRKAASRRTGRKVVTRKQAVTRKLKKAARPATRKSVRGIRLTTQARKTPRRAVVRKAKDTRSTTARRKAAKKLLDARARKKLAAARKAAAKARAKELARKRLEKKLAIKARKEAIAAKKLARKLAAKEAKARAMEAVRARRARLAEEKARKKAAEAAAKAAAKQAAREAALKAKEEAKAAKARAKLELAEARRAAGTHGKGKSAQPARGSAPPDGTAPARSPIMRPALPPIPIEPPKPSLEERAAAVSKRLESESEALRKEYEERLFMSWIHHDCALEGVVYSFHELQVAINPTIAVVPDSSMQPVCDEIRRYKQAIEFVLDAATNKRMPVSTDVIKRIYLILHPEEGDLKTVKYRKDIPQHRLYFHEYAPPDKIAYLVRQVVEWVNDPETRRTRTALRIAARAHYDLLRTFPFATDSGKVARLFMNFLLLRAGYPPAIIHASERQRYYEALKNSPLAVVHMVQEALENSIASIDKFLDERTTRVRSFVS